jgi:tetratricopeptide (TPR) repeat protein
MKKINLIWILCIALYACSHNQNEHKIVNQTDYASYLNTNEASFKEVGNQESSTTFWEKKLKEEPRGYTFMQKLAIIKAENFEKSGKIEYLHQSDSFLLLANSYVSGKKQVGNYLSLSSNAITQHQFKSAFEYAVEASKRTDEKFGPYLMIFDAAMEIGEYGVAEEMLDKTERNDSFDFLVRKSKFKDHTGDLDSAINLMEQAVKTLGKNDDRIIWAQANLADMYGHAGKLEQSYATYLAVLNKNPEYLHALKGIAWLVFSHDNDVEAAKAITQYLSAKTALPDGHLMLAQLAAFKGDDKERLIQLKAFEKEATKPKYQNMYNKYLASLYAEDFKNYDKALAIAKTEVKNRPTPTVYGLLAWVYEQKGEHKNALAIVNKHVKGKTFEPEAIYQMGIIYASNNEMSTAKEFLNEASEAWFELGPLKTKEVNLKLSEI